MVLVLLSTLLITTVSDPDTSLLDSVYFRYEPLPYDTTASPVTGAVAQDSADLRAGALRIRGAKDFSFDIKRGFDQGLKVDITGEVEGVSIEGNLSDKATPAQTTRISEIERMSLKAYTKNFTGALGNLTLDLPFGIRDEIKGGRISLHGDDKKQSVSAAYAINRGMNVRLRFSGEEGRQSPYFLEGPVIASSERVYLGDGMLPLVLLSRESDYQIDYENGIISFSNDNIITSRTRIEVEYQKAVGDYLNTYAQADGALSLGPAVLRGLYRRSADDNDNPLTFVLAPSEIESLGLAGDSASVLHTYADTASEGSYILENGHFSYVGQGNGDYDVSFFYVGEQNGDYVYDPVISAFTYAGVDLGNYSPTKVLPLPRRDEFYAMSAEFYRTLTVHVYGSRLDKNTFSPIDDADNDGIGYRARLERTVGLASLECEYLKYGENFSSPVGREGTDYQYIWNVTEPVDEIGSAAIGLTPTDFLGLRMGYGMLNRTHHRRMFSLHPFFFNVGWESVDSLDRYYADFRKSWQRVMLTGRYETYGTVQIARYGAQYAIDKQTTLRLNGSYDRDTISSAVMNTFDISTSAWNIGLGHRSLNDTTFYFGNASVRYSFRGISFLGDIAQTQRYSQMRDEAFIKVDEGDGDYVYDPVTGTYIMKENGDYIRKIFLLPDFSRVITRNYAIEAGYAASSFDMNGRFYFIDEENFRSHSENVLMNASFEPWDFALDVRQDIQEDGRYTLGTNSTTEQTAAFIPSVHALRGRIEIENSTEKTAETVRERRRTYRTEISFDVIERPLVRPKARYSYARIYSDYFAGFDARQDAPGAGILVSVPFKRIGGKVETTIDFVYRSYSIDEVPFFFSANEPEGLTTALGAVMSFGIGANTLFSLVYRLEFRPDEAANHNFRLQSRIRF